MRQPSAPSSLTSNEMTGRCKDKGRKLDRKGFGSALNMCRHRPRKCYIKYREIDKEVLGGVNVEPHRNPTFKAPSRKSWLAGRNLHSERNFCTVEFSRRSQGTQHLSVLRRRSATYTAWKWWPFCVWRWWP